MLKKLEHVTSTWWPVWNNACMNHISVSGYVEQIFFENAHRMQKGMVKTRYFENVQWMQQSSSFGIHRAEISILHELGSYTTNCLSAIMTMRTYISFERGKKHALALYYRHDEY